MPKLYRIGLSGAERQQLSAMIRKGKASARKRLHAQVLLKADEASPQGNWKDQDIAQALEIGIRTVERVRQCCVEEGLEAALIGRPSRRRYHRVLDGKGEAQLIALACGPAPQGRRRWTLKLLSERLVELEVVEQISTNTVGRTLKKMNLSLG